MNYQRQDRQKQIYKIMHSLHECPMPVLGKKNKILLKKRIFNELNLSENSGNNLLFLDKYGVLRNFFLKIKRELLIDRHSSAYLKEKILQEIDQHSQNNFSWWNVFSGRKAWASIFTIAIVLSVIIPLWLENSLIYAAKQNYLKVEAGPVSVLRDSSVIVPSGLFRLKQGDTVITGPGGKAELHFANNSIARLSDDTKLEITKLSEKPREKDQVVAVSLDKGRMWSKMVSLPSNENQLIVSTGDTLMVTANKKAAFDLEVDEKSVNVRSLENVVQVHVFPEDDKILKKSVLEGYRIELRETPETEEKVEVKIVKEENANSTDVWVTENKRKDSEYAETLKEKLAIELSEEVALITDENVSTSKSKADLTVDILLNKLHDVGGLLAAYNYDRSDAIFTALNSKIQSLVRDVENLKNVQATNIDALKKRLSRQIEVLEKAMVQVLPDSNLYLFKQKLRELQILVARSPDDLISLKLRYGADMLLEISDLVVKRKEALTAISFENYLKLVNEVSAEINAIEAKSRAKFMEYFLASQVSDLETFKIIEHKARTKELQLGTGYMINSQLDTIYKTASAIDFMARGRTAGISNKRLKNLSPEQKVKLVGYLKSWLSISAAEQISKVESLYGDTSLVEITISKEGKETEFDVVTTSSVTPDVDVRFK